MRLGGPAWPWAYKGSQVVYLWDWPALWGPRLVISWVRHLRCVVNPHSYSDRKEGGPA